MNLSTLARTSHSVVAAPRPALPGLREGSPFIAAAWQQAEGPAIGADRPELDASPVGNRPARVPFAVAPGGYGAHTTSQETRP